MRDKMKASTRGGGREDTCDQGLLLYYSLVQSGLVQNAKEGKTAQELGWKVTATLKRARPKTTLTNSPTEERVRTN